MTAVALPVSPGIVRRLTATLFAGQSIASLGTTGALTIGSIAITQLVGSPALAGAPTTLYILGTALGAYPAGRLMDRYGRRLGLILGFLLGLAGASLGAAAMLGILPWVLLLAYAIMGLGRGALDQGRFAAADMVGAGNRARAVSWVVLGGTVGGIGGPLFIGPASKLVGSLGLEPLAGPYVAGALLLALGGVMVATLLRPDPHDIARALFTKTRLEVGQGTAAPAALLAARTFREALRSHNIQTALASLVLGQVVMTTVMVMTPLEMTEHLGHTLDDVSLVIAAHITGMYATSVLTGRIADRFGHTRTILVGAFFLVLSCVLAPFAGDTLRLAVTLFVLGAGWNLCFVSGSSLLTDSLRPNERGRIQGASDLLIGLVSATGSLSSGLAFATVGYPGIALAGITLALALFGIALWTLQRHMIGVETPPPGGS